jgi:DnaK suppressor protein
MKKELVLKLKEKLEKEKSSLEKELEGFAEKDERIKGDWDTKYPRTSGGSLEEAADEVEEYGNLLPVEHSLELRLKNINRALEKIKEGDYGKCEKCGKKISEQRLKVHPSSLYCKKCSQ